MGCGKSVVGVLVAQRTGAPFVDLDFEIENEAGMSINEIFATRGEQAFRALEARLLPKVLEPGSVVAVGGGAPVDDSNWRLISGRATTVFLDCGFETIWNRIGSATTRPLVASRSRAELEAMFHERRPRYLEAVHHVDADRPANVVADEIVQLWSD